MYYTNQHFIAILDNFCTQLSNSFLESYNQTKRDWITCESEDYRLFGSYLMGNEL